MQKPDHFDSKGKIQMADHTGKPVKLREAEATGFIHMKSETVRLIKDNETEKGEIITIAEVAGMQAAKSTCQLIPLLHHSSPQYIEVKAYVFPNGIEVKSHIKAEGRSGMEMESLTAVSAALLTLYEFCKNEDSSLVISDIKLSKKIIDE